MGYWRLLPSQHKAVGYLWIALLLSAGSLFAAERPYQYFRAGSPHDVQTKMRPGFAFMGGGADLDDAFKLHVRALRRR